ncbi:MAG: hypothetical protein K2I95_10380 [Treponemataceae bacterium]|nr:hypothetical protein [Treponemataceae bacterium]
MLVREGETLFFDTPKEARRFLKCSQVEYECALDLGKSIDGWCVDETIGRRKRRKKND